MDDKVLEGDERDTGESSPQPGRTLRRGKETGHKEIVVRKRDLRRRDRKRRDGRIGEVLRRERRRRDGRRWERRHQK